MTATNDKRDAWIHRGFDDFSRGRFDDGGSNLYVNARGVIETIHRADIDNDGYVDIVLPNSHGYIERAPTSIYQPQLNDRDAGGQWPCRDLPNDSGWMSRIVDLDGDGHHDLVVANGENGVTSELDSYVYWGSRDGLSEERTVLPTIGAYDVAITDVNGNGLSDLIFPSAWVDHHNPGRPIPLRVYLQTAPRHFEDASEEFGLIGLGASSVACADLTGNGRPDLVVANYRSEFEYDCDSFVYWGNESGFDADHPFCLPTHYVLQVLLGDLNNDGFQEIIFCGGNQVQIYWNERGTFDPERRTILEAKGFDTMFCFGALRAEVADVDGDGANELILATEQGIQIRSSRDLEKVDTFLPLPYSSWVTAADLDNDGRPELIVSKYENRVNYETESVIYWNGVDGYSPDRVSRVATAGAMGNTSGDLNGDGLPVVVFNSTLRGPSQFNPDFPAYVYRGGPGGDYGVHRRLDLPSGGGTYGYVLADLDLDGYADLVISTLVGVRIFPGGPDGPQPDRFQDLVTDWAHGMQILVGDFNRSGYLDLLLMVQTYDTKPQTMASSSIFFYGSADGFSSDNRAVLPTYCSGIGFAADLDGNGYLDVITDDKRGFLVIFPGGPQGYDRQRATKIPFPVELTASINAADLTGNGYLDLIVSIQSHYLRTGESCYIFYGGPEGYDLARSQRFDGGYTPGDIAVADLDNDGRLELIVSGYSTDATRVMPTQIFRMQGDRIDFDHPQDLPADSGFAFLPVDINGNGYPDLVIACHRNDEGHQVDSLIYHNGPEGMSPDRVTRIPGLGPHWMSTRDPGNAHTREPVEHYESPPFELQGRTPARIEWDADVPDVAKLKFQLRWAEQRDELPLAPWTGPHGPESCYVQSGEAVAPAPSAARWLQYRAHFVCPNVCMSPQLREVRIELSHSRQN